ncbi:MAG: chromosomal replication initiator protein DnaA [Bacilli bacterium]|nr:chromosomal replication initiator protein DnaA [Bacilli bacterium]
MDNEKFFNDFLQCISTKITPISYNTWFANVKLLSNENNNLVFEVENKYKKDYIKQYYDDLIDEVLDQLTSSNYTYDVKSSDEVEEVKCVVETELPKFKRNNSGLQPNYTFNNYIVGESNRLAQMTAMAVAENPGMVYNPFFIYGKSGVGKTHLMHAIGNYIQENSNKTVLYVSIDTFINDFININIARKNEDNSELVEQFKNKYRNVDVLIIDDIQLLSNATKTQGEFFNTFEYLHQSNKQIIVSSDRSPDDLKLLEDRLRTRFAWGLTVCISPPDYDLRIKILRNKLIGLEIGTMMTDEVLEYIANNFDSDVRHLEGALNTIYANVSLMKPKEINLEFAVEVLRNSIGSNIYITNNVAKIQKAVADYFDLTVENLKSKKRTANINLARQIAMYLCKMTTSETLDRIGLEFNRDHATVIHASDKIEQELKTSEERQKQIKEIKVRIAN